MNRTPEQFYEAVGRYPRDDDLDRVNCPKEGELGHQACGWCPECNKPWFLCWHFAERVNMLPRDRT